MHALAEHIFYSVDRIGHCDQDQVVGLGQRGELHQAGVDVDAVADQIAAEARIR